MKILFSFILLSTIVTYTIADPQPLAIGAQAPDFSLPGVDGKTYSLADFSNAKILVVIFTCNHCPTAQAYEERIKQLTASYQAKGVALVAISPNDPLSVRLDELGYSDLSDSFEEMKIRAADQSFNFPYLYDGETSKVSFLYGPQATPHAFVFDSTRKLRYTGRIDDGEKPGTAKSHDLKNAIEALLNNSSVPVEKTKTFGCSIKWPDKRDYAKSAYEEWAKEPVAINELSLEELKTLVANNKSGEFLLINVWATWCGPCVTEFPHFVDMNRMYRNREFELVTISLDDINRKQNALNFLTRKQASTVNYIFNGNRYDFIDAMDKDWEGSLPYTIFVSPEGKVIFKKQGLIDPLELKKIIVSKLGRIY